MRDYHALAQISGPLLLEVLIGRGALHKTSPCSAHRANNDFVIAGEVVRQDKAIPRKTERKRPKIGAVGRKAYYTTIQGIVRNRRGSNNASVIFK